MAPNGSLVVSTPFIGGMWYKILGKKWPFFIPPEHVCLYNHNSISQLLKQTVSKTLKCLSLHMPGLLPDFYQNGNAQTKFHDTKAQNRRCSAFCAFYNNKYYRLQIILTTGFASESDVFWNFQKR